VNHELGQDMSGVTFSYLEDAGAKVYDPCFGTAYPDGTVVVQPNVNGNPAFLEPGIRGDELDPTAKGHVFDTKITRLVMETMGVDVNVWSVADRKWVTQ